MVGARVEHAGLNVRRAVAALSLGHGVNDLYMGFLPALLPALVDRLHLTYGRAGLLVTFVTLWSHVAQPAIGYGADRVGRRYLVVLGPLITAVAMSWLGLVDSYTGLLTALVIGSVGNAIFHPIGASLTGSVSRGSGTAMAVFSAGGSVGYGLGSWVIVEVVERLGLERTWTMAAFGVLTAVFMLTSLPRAAEATHAPRREAVDAPRLHWVAPLIILFLVVMLRAAEATVVTTFVPLLLHARGADLRVGGYAVLAFSLAGAVGGLIGGPLSRRIGSKWTTVVSLAIAGPALYLFLQTDGLLAAALFCLAGAGVFAALPANIVMAQELLPRHASMASGVVMGLAWGIGSFSAKLVGNGADRFSLTLGSALGLQRALEYSALLLVAATVVALFLSETRRPRPADAVEPDGRVRSAARGDGAAR